MKISSVICTYNREDFLAKAISSLVNQTLAKDEYEIIVVDNASKDNTKKIVEEDYKKEKNVKYIYEAKLGLSQARNTGIKHSKGTYIAFLDDDAIADPHWLETIVRCFENSDKKLGCVGGKVEPIWDIKPQDWLPELFYSYLSVLDWSDKPLILSSEQWLVGANIAFPKAELEMVGCFNTKLGRKGKKLLSGEEVEVRYNLEQMGYQALYHPDVKVQHFIPRNRMKKEWFYKRLFWQGVDFAIFELGKNKPSYLKRIVIAMKELGKLLKSRKNFILLFRKAKNKEEFQRKCFALKNYGFFLKMLGLK
jgi:glycosyltransferase involved in cell wall biosynthesis